MTWTTLVLLNAEGTALGRVTETAGLGWKWFPFSCAHQPSRIYHPTLEKAVPRYIYKAAEKMLTWAEFKALPTTKS